MVLKTLPARFPMGEGVGGGDPRSPLLCLFSLPAACEVGFYKPVAGDGLCGKCPQHSHSETRAALSCPCDSRYYRTADDPSAAPCSRKLKHTLTT